MIYINKLFLVDAVYEALRELHEYGDKVQGENQSNKDTLLEDQLTLVVKNPIGDNYCIPKCIAGGLEDLASYVDEFLRGTKDGKFTYTYHELYSQYMERCKAEIERYSYTRRAVLPIAGEASYSSQYPPCLQLLIPRIVKYENNDGEEELDLMAVFRSNDAVNAFPMNIFAIAMLQGELANEFCVQPGRLTYVANSFHCYSRDLPKLEGYVKRWRQAKKIEDIAFRKKEYLDAIIERDKRKEH